MEDIIGTLIGVIAGVFVCLVFVGLIVLAFIMGKRNTQKTKMAIQQLEETYGLVNQKPKGIYIDMNGEVDGIEVAVDVIFQSYASSGPSNSQRPWTRIRAQLPDAPQIQVRSRHQKYGGKIEWPEQESGDPVFDQKYILYIAEGASLDEALPPTVKDALIAADPPVHVLKSVVLWSKIKTGHSPELLTNAVKSCVNVASAIKQHNQVQDEI